MRLAFFGGTVGLVAGLVLLACSVEQPGAFEGPKIGKAKDDVKADKDKGKGTSGGTSGDDDDDTDPAPTPTKPAVDAGPVAPNLRTCGGATAIECVRCCDTNTVYETFLVGYVNCPDGQEDTCLIGASKTCLADPTCKGADECVQRNRCFDKPDGGAP